ADAIHRYDLAGLGAGVLEEEPKFDKSPLEDILEMTFPVDPKLKRRVREEAAATSSQLPLTVNDSVLGFIHYFSGRGRRTMIAGLQRAGRYRPMIQRILDEEGIPQELIHLAQAESGFFPRALSRKMATGMWQFVKFRGNEYGLKQTAYSDDRLDPEKATRAAARHLRDLYHRYGDWYLAIAAYNCGPGTVDRAVERTGYADFWELRSRRTLPLETTNYVPIVLAMTIMAKNARQYELEDVTPDPPIEYDVIEPSSPTHLALVADLTETPMAELQSLNPSLLRSVAPAGHSLRVPKGTANALVARLDTIPAERRATWRAHKVENGETLAVIGKRYGA
ncbi:MAG: lytic transglycosylase domain-containing protein, partial [Bryobacteraceae bacterium]